MSIAKLLALIACGVVLFYGVIPMTGVFLSRTGWRAFRRRFYALSGRPMLDYAACRQAAPGEEFRFTGTVDAAGEGGGGPGGATLWLQGDDGLLVPADTAAARMFSLPGTDAGNGKPAPLYARSRLYTRGRFNGWRRLRPGRREAAFPEGRVFAGGVLADDGGRKIFRTEKDRPLILIFYQDGGVDEAPGELTGRVIDAGRQRIEYWNSFTPWSLACGICFLMAIALAYIARPAYSFVVVCAFAGIFTPLFPFLPPGLLLTLGFQQLWLRARRLMAAYDRETLRGGRVSGGHFRLAAFFLECAAWFLLLLGIACNLLFVGALVFVRGLW